MHFSVITYLHNHRAESICTRQREKAYFPTRTGVPNGTIWVYSLSGELLQELKETEGKYALEWDGILSDGNLISSGVYFYTGINPKEPTGNKGYFTVRK